MTTPSRSVPEPFDGDPRFLEWTARAAAHDLCNQLLAIQWSSSLLDESREEPAAVCELASEIDEAVGRARGSLSFLSLLVSPAPAAGARSLDVRELLDHACGLIRLALGSDVGVELDLERCAPCRLAVEPSGFVRSLVRLATGCASARPTATLSLEAETCFEPVAGTREGSLQLAIACQRREGAGGLAKAAEAGLEELARYVEHRLGGELSRRGAEDWRLRVAAVGDGPDRRGIGERPIAVVAPPPATTTGGMGRRSR